MPLILAIEPDHQQSALLASVLPRQVHAELVLVPTVEQALQVLETRVPDLLLTPLLLSTRDDAALTGRVRELDDRGIAVPVLVIPLLSAEEAGPQVVQRPNRLLTLMRRPKTPIASPPKGCRPELFADQIDEYLARAAAERTDREALAPTVTWNTTRPAATAPLLAELLPLPTAPSPISVPEPESTFPLDDQVDPGAVVTGTVPQEQVMPAVEIAAPDVETPAADEIWTPLPMPASQLMAPLEGPSVKPRTPVRRPRGRKAEPTAAKPARVAQPRGVRKTAKPMQDEWGLYDPEQCGFAALLERLEEMTGRNALVSCAGDGPQGSSPDIERAAVARNDGRRPDSRP
jgi:CheY-like chemotaxis protein